MVSRFRLVFAVLGLGIIISGSSAVAIEFSSMSSSDAVQLELDFDEARSLTSREVKSSPEWDCKLYGMRSQLLVQTFPKFYRWKRKGKNLVNKGSQIVHIYNKNSQGFHTGTNGPFIDEVRITDNGQIISRFSVQQRAELRPQVLSYARCSNSESSDSS